MDGFTTVLTFIPQCGSNRRDGAVQARHHGFATALYVRELDQPGFSMAKNMTSKAHGPIVGHISASRKATRTLLDSVVQIMDMVASVRSSETMEG